MSPKILSHLASTVFFLCIAVATVVTPAQAESLPIGGTVTAIDTVRNTITVDETIYTLSQQIKVLNADVDGRPEADITIIQVGKYVEIETHGKVIYRILVHSQVPT